MTEDSMRGYIRKAYPGEGWKRKVDAMDKDQVIAVYFSLIGRKKKEAPVKHEEDYHQITLFELGLK